ncbi:MAG: DegV family protein [Solirubrobacterales bacterium]
MSPQANAAIVCDTTAYLPDEMITARGIERISLYVALGGEQRKEIDVVDYGSFFERLRASEDGATTSQPSVGDFVGIYGPLLDDGRDVVSNHISSTLSGTYESALQARQSLIDDGRGGERIHVVDSRTGGGGMAMVVLAAAAAAAAGNGADEIVERARKAREELRMWFALDTLEYLKRGGRIGGARAWLGSALQIKPILTFEEEVTPIERVRTRQRVFERLVKYAEELHAEGRDAWVVQHIQNRENAQRLVERCREVMGSDPMLVSEVGPVIGAHIGPGMLGVGGVPSELLR